MPKTPKLRNMSSGDQEPTGGTTVATFFRRAKSQRSTQFLNLGEAPSFRNTPPRNSRSFSSRFVCTSKCLPSAEYAKENWSARGTLPRRVSLPVANSHMHNLNRSLMGSSSKYGTRSRCHKHLIQRRLSSAPAGINEGTPWCPTTGFGSPLDLQLEIPILQLHETSNTEVLPPM